MRPSSVHRGDFKRLRRNLTVALLEAEAMEPRVQVAYSRDEIPAEFAANLSLCRLLLQRADALIRAALDRDISDMSKYEEIYSESTYSDERLAGIA